MTEIHHNTPEAKPKIVDSVEKTKDLLFNLADQLVASDSDWNVLIGDDAGGRLPTRFVHDVLKQDGRELKTRFVVGSSIYRKANGPAPYDEYFRQLREEIGEPLRPLIVTESTWTGGTLDFLKSTLEPYCDPDQKIEIAALAAVTPEAAENVDYVGGVGKTAADAVVEAYESPTESSVKKKMVSAVGRVLPRAVKQRVRNASSRALNPYNSPNRTAGTEVSLEAPLPIVVTSPNRDARLATTAFRAMDQLAGRYSAERKSSKLAA